MKKNESIDIERALLESSFLSIEQKFDLKEKGFCLKDGKFFINTEEVISSPITKEPLSIDPEAFIDPSLEPITISPEVLEIGLKYANRKISQRKWTQAHYRAEKNIRNTNKKMSESKAFKRTTLEKLGLLDPNLSSKAMHEKTRRYNQAMQEDGIAKITVRRRGEIKTTVNGYKKTKKSAGRYSSNKYEMTDIGFETLKLLEDNKLLYSSPKEIIFFLNNGLKMTPQKKGKKHAKRGVPRHEVRSTTESISKRLSKDIVRNGKPSSVSFSKESKKNDFSKKEIDLGKEFGKRLQEVVGRAEHSATLTLQTQTLLKFNKGDIEATRAHHERILSEHKRQQKKGIIKNEGAWRQSAINRGIELNGTMQPVKEKEKDKTKKSTKKSKKSKQAQEKPQKDSKKTSQKKAESRHKEKKASFSSTERNAQLKEIHEAIQILPRRSEISRFATSIWLSTYKSTERIKNAIWAAYERNKQYSGINNLEAYITTLIQKEVKPRKFDPQEHETIQKNKSFLREKILKLREKGISLTTKKSFREGRDFYEIVLSRQKCCGDFDLLEIAFYDPKLGELINDFEKKHDDEKQNIPENKPWVDETIKSLGKENQKLKIQEIHAGYRLYVKIEQVIGDQKRRFMDHIDLKLSRPKTTLEKDLNAFLKRNQLTQMKKRGDLHGE